MGEFHWLDYTLFLATIVASLVLGIYKSFSKHAKDGTNDYLLGSRQMALLPVSLSIIMSRVSSISVLGNVAEIYLHGTQIFLVYVTGVLTTMLSGYFLVPLIYRLRITSAFEYFDLRFGSKVLRKLASLLQILMYLFYAGSCAYGPSTALAAVTSLPLWVGIVGTAGVGSIYTAIGGIRAVIWTDAFQALLFFFGLLTIMAVGIVQVGGLAEVFRISGEGGRLSLFNMDPDLTIRATFWNTSLSYFFEALTAVASVQTTVQRIQSCKSESQAIRAVLMHSPLWIIMEVILLMCALTIYAYYETLGCDPYRSSQISSPNQLLPLFVVDVLSWPGIPGLFIAVLFSGSLSSISSVLNSCAGLTWVDFLSTYYPTATNKTQSRINKLLSCFYGLLTVVIAFIIDSSNTHILQVFISVSGALYSPIAGLFFLGVVFPWVQWKGAFIGLLCGFGLTSWMNIGKRFNPYHKSFLDTNVSECKYPYNTTWPVPMDTPPEDVFVLYRFSFLWIPLIGWFITVSIGLLASFLTCPQDPKLLNPNTLIPWRTYFRRINAKRNISTLEDDDVAETVLQKQNEIDNKCQFKTKTYDFTRGGVEEEERPMCGDVALTKDTVTGDDF